MNLPREKTMRQMILGMASKYTYNERHALFVEGVSLLIFDVLAAPFDLREVERQLLSHAALLHDIGNCISEKKHHKHTKYIIDHDENLNEYPEKDKLLLSLVAYNHRKKLSPDMDSLPKRERDMVCKLSAILRVADALDFTREEAEIKKAVLEGSDLKLTVEGVLPERLMNGLSRKKELFYETFQLDIILSMP